MKATLSLLTKATLSLWLISSLPAFAATEKISALPVTTLLASNDFLVVNIWNGSAFVSKTIAFTNLPIGLNLRNSTNLPPLGINFTNGQPDIITNNRTTAFNFGSYLYGTNAALGGCPFT